MKKVLLALLLVLPGALQAQSAGETGAQVLQFAPGARASAFAGAYIAAHDDADALFYNAAGVAAQLRGASAAFENHATDVAFGSVAGFTRLGAVRIGIGLIYLNAGEAQEIVPDPEFGGNTGTPTGNTVTASELAARIAFAVPLQSARLRVGGSLGFVAVNIADLSEHAPLADFGLQYDVGTVTLAVAARHLGSAMSGENADPLPTELRAGIHAPVTLANGIGISAFADAVSRVREGSFGIAGGVEAGIRPRTANDLGAVARVGYDADNGHLGALRFGAGLSVRAVSFDYAYQHFDIAGAVHRIGIRWSR